MKKGIDLGPLAMSKEEAPFIVPIELSRKGIQATPGSVFTHQHLMFSIICNLMNSVMIEMQITQ